MQIPKLGEQLNQEQLELLEAFAKSCRYSIIAMLKNSQSGHPGGSLSSIDYLTLLYSFILSQTGEKIVISNGHISPAVYSVLAELKYVNKDDVIANFRKVGSVFEGHVTRHIPGIWYGTGPLGVGVAAASGMAWAEKHDQTGKKVFAVMGDGEADEGEVYEMMHFANKYQLNNLIVFMDWNQVQLTDATIKIMPLNLKATFEAANWLVIEVDGHDYQALWRALAKAYQSDKPVILLGKTIMGKGVDFMEKEGLAYRSTWHGKAPNPEQADIALAQLIVGGEQKELIANFVKDKLLWHPKKPDFVGAELSKVKIGKPRLYTTEILTDCRTAYGMALLDLAELNENIIAATADLGHSVMTKFVQEKFPTRGLEIGIAEQEMVSMAGGLSLSGKIPFVSTFGVFITSRAKDQARVNDINLANVKMVVTHCGLSVGEDGPTHQAIDDSGSMLGLFHTLPIEAIDPNQCDRVIRYIAATYGNFYVRMGRHKFPIITDIDGQPFYKEDYIYSPGKTDIIREGKDLTVVASGPMVHEALIAWEELNKIGYSIEIVAISSIRKFDDNLINSIKKTGKVITMEDHNPYNGLYTAVTRQIAEAGIAVRILKSLAVTEYQFSGKAEELYKQAGISASSLIELVKQLK